ncbi:MAG: signal recognition particle receptor subunit alpha, partial [Cytophagales bacterium]|nr:signal recognition particle receptor subunit alpha [Cytophagales bacterium]
MFDALRERIDSGLRHLKGAGQITEVNVARTAKEVLRALVQSDVEYKVAKAVAGRLKERALGEKVLISVSPGDLFVKIAAEELGSLMGGEHVPPDLSGNPNVILIIGLQGSGKT